MAYAANEHETPVCLVLKFLGQENMLANHNAGVVTCQAQDVFQKYLLF